MMLGVSDSPGTRDGNIIRGPGGICRFIQEWHVKGPSSRGEITKNNKCRCIIKDDNFMITCADRSTLMAGLIKLPHILGFKFISPRLLGPVVGILEELCHYYIPLVFKV